jgi:hypothetical protein
MVIIEKQRRVPGVPPGTSALFCLADFHDVFLKYTGNESGGNDVSATHFDDDTIVHPLLSIEAVRAYPAPCFDQHVAE